MNAWKRIGAFAIDWCVFAVWAGAVFAIAWFGQGGKPDWPANPWLGQLVGFALTTLPFGLYLALMEASRWQATVGKRCLGLRVVTLDGERPSLGRTVGRTTLKLLPWELGHVAPYQLIALARDEQATPTWLMILVTVALATAVWYAASLWSASDRTPYDRPLGTRVVRVRA